MIFLVADLVRQGNLKGSADLQGPSGFTDSCDEFSGHLLFFLKLVDAAIQLVGLAAMASLPKLEPLQLVKIDFFIEQGTNDIRGFGGRERSFHELDLLPVLFDAYLFFGFQWACFKGFGFINEFSGANILNYNYKLIFIFPM